MRIAHHLAKIGSIDSVTTSYEFKILHFLFVESIKSTRGFEWYCVTCGNGLGEI